ncbi:MAG: glycosyltransferase [Bryobacteraceae bacterium]|nr:glycosyltransferase [Bryobacteraceae bacterium]
MRVGFHSPLPPAPTGVADYAAVLLTELRRFGEVQLGARRADVHLYHIGNNPLHWRIYHQALAQPGVAVLHDAVLHHLLLGKLGRETYIEEFVYNYGEWSRPAAAELWAGRGQSAGAEVYFRHPMLRRIAERSQALVVHNPAAARMVKQHAPEARAEQIPHLWRPPPAIGEAERLRLRQAMGIPTRSFVFGVFGHLRETKRLPAVLRAFRRVRAQGIEAALLVAGRFASQDLERSLQPELRTEGVVRAGWTDPARFEQLLQAADAGINLRYPGAGETSGVAIRLMGAGKPVILSASEETSAFPPETCLKASPGIAEEDELEHHMVLLASARQLASEMGHRAAAYIRAHHAAQTVAESCWRILCECSGARS